MTERFGNWIGGRQVEPCSGEYLDSESPIDGSVVASVARGNAADAAAAAVNAADAQPAWAAFTPTQRSRHLHAVAAALREELDHLVHFERAETGKPEAAAVAELTIAIDYFEYYGSLARAISGNLIEAGPGQHIYTRRQPYGVIAVITPWNAPLNQACRSLAPALAAGNAVVLKPSEFTSLTSLELGRIAGEAGLPAGLVNVVTGVGEEVGEPLVSHEAVRKICFTGSVVAGRRVGQIAAQRIVPITLELGGKSPNIVFDDADLERAAEVAVASFTANAGQICSAGTRVLVQRGARDAFLRNVTERVRALRVGEEIGPIITSSQFEKVQGYLELARSENLGVLAGGDIASDGELAKGRFVNPTVYAGVSNSSRIAQEEIFGPVLSVIDFDTEAEAIQLANDTPYGLVAGVWSRDIGRALRVAERIDAGQVYVNQWVAPIEAPFGGFKQSGHGREKGFEALHDYTQVKSIVVDISR